MEASSGATPIAPPEASCSLCPRSNRRSRALSSTPREITTRSPFWPNSAGSKAPPPIETQPKPKPKPEPQAARPVAQPPEEPPVEPAPGEPAEATGDATAAVESLTGGASEFAWYRTSVTAALYSHWRRPILAGLAEPREVLVSFEILRDGRASDVRVSQSSGVPSLDRSALRAVQDASPLPPLPSGLSGASLSASFLFRLFPE